MESTIRTQVSKNICCHCLEKFVETSQRNVLEKTVFSFSSLLLNNVKYTVFSALAKVYGIPEDRLIPVDSSDDPRALCYTCAFLLGAWVKSFDDFHYRLKDRSHIQQAYVNFYKKFLVDTSSELKFEDFDSIEFEPDETPNSQTQEQFLDLVSGGW